jgi:dTDP-4-amino-4,6-dideoxygalactose transaminase
VTIEQRTDAPFIPPARPEIGEEEIEAAVRVLRSGMVVQGPEVAGFEDEFAALVDGRHCVAVNSGTSALLLALVGLGIGGGDEVIVPSFTFAATANAVRLTGATPVFADIDPETFCLDPASVSAVIGPRTAAIMPVHLYGHPAAMDEFARLAARHGLAVVEDAAQAHLASLHGRAVGTFGAVAAFSFYPTKNLGGPGDGGMVTTSDARLAERLRLLRSHGSRTAYVHEEIGLNSRLDDLQAAVLRVKLPHLDAWNERRRAAASRYRSALAGRPIVAPVELRDAHHIYHHFTVRCPDRAETAKRLDARGIASAVYYPRALHQQPAYAKYANGPLPHAERAAAEVLSVPVHPWLTEDEVLRVERALVD